MTADLLRRAAAKLREAATAAPEGPWVSLNDGDRLVALRPNSVFPKGFRYLVDEPIDDTSIAEYFALMHPPVALALAELLDQAAEVRLGQGKGTPEGGWAASIPAWIEPSLLALARAILREEES